jgi:dihydrofolate synthase/folylpolyglutamate synthase
MLAEALGTYFSGQKPALILGILRDKDWPRMCELLAPRASRILLVPVHSERTAEPHGLAEVCQTSNPGAPVLECDSLETALTATEKEPFVVVAGSLYLIGEAMELLHISADRQRSERQLNEWGGIPSR